MADIDVLENLAKRRPDDPRPRFGLAAEYEKRGDWARTVEHLRAYLRMTDDQGNAYGRLGRALRQLGEEEEAIEAYRKGIAAARRHNHPTLAEEFEEVIRDMTGLP